MSTNPVSPIEGNTLRKGSALLAAFAVGILTAPFTVAVSSQVQAQAKRPNIVMLMTDDTGWQDFGTYSGGGATLGHTTPNVDRIAKEGATFTNWYGQASCTAGGASFISNNNRSLLAAAAKSQRTERERAHSTLPLCDDLPEMPARDDDSRPVTLLLFEG
jgi:hypothetical protein